jgi:hypothetical protein
MIMYGIEAPNNVCLLAFRKRKPEADETLEETETEEIEL